MLEAGRIGGHNPQDLARFSFRRGKFVTEKLVNSQIVQEREQTKTSRTEDVIVWKIRDGQTYTPNSLWCQGGLRL